MRDMIFIDTNIWIYVYALDPQGRHSRAQELVRDDFERIMVSSQVLGELYHVLIRKGFQTPAMAKETVSEISSAFSVMEIGAGHVPKAIRVPDWMQEDKASNP